MCYTFYIRHFQLKKVAHVVVRFRWLLALYALLGGLLHPAPALAAPWQRAPVLSRVLIKQLLTDATGFQWVAADEGVFRYDGYELVPLARLILLALLSLSTAWHRLFHQFGWPHPELFFESQ